MEFKDFVYLSNRKIDQMYSQLVATDSGQLEVRGEATIGFAKVGATVKPHEASDSIQKLARLIAHLRESGQIGTLADEAKYFAATISAHCLLIGQAFFFADVEVEYNGLASHVLLGLTCSLEHMVGGDYETTEGLDDLGTPRGKAKAYGIKWTSAHPGFAAKLTSADRVGERAEQLSELRRVWTEKYQLLDADRHALSKMKLLNGLIEFIHLKAVSSNFWGLALERTWPPAEPEPRVEMLHPNRILSWILGPHLYEAKIAAINKQWQFRQALNATAVDPLQIEVLREVRSRVNDLKPPVRLSYNSETMLKQTYDCLAVRVADAIIDGERVVLASPIYLAL